MDTLAKVADFLAPIIPYSFLASVIVLIILMLVDGEGVTAFFALPFAFVVWVLVQIGVSLVKWIRDGFAFPISDALITFGVAGIAQLYLIYAILTAIDSIRNPTSDTGSGSSMDDKARIFDADGNLIGYIDRD